MCGRFERRFTIEQLANRYGIERDGLEFEAKEEVFPTESSPVVLMAEDSARVKVMKWGFLPSYVKRPLINARCETIDEKVTFRNSYYSRRCIVPVSAFFEWEKTEEMSIKRRITAQGEDIMSIAGLYDSFKDKNGQIYSAFTIITTDASLEISKIHDRMPLILPKVHEMKWIDPEFEMGRISKMLKTYEGKLKIE